MSLMGNRAQQCDGDKAVNNYKHRRHDCRSRRMGQVYVNKSTLANGSADHGRKRLRVNLVFWSGTTSTRMGRGHDCPATFAGTRFEGARSVTSQLVSRLLAGVFIRRLNLLQDAIQVVGLRRLQGWEGLVRHEFLFPQQLTDGQHVPVVHIGADRAA